MNDSASKSRKVDCKAKPNAPEQGRAHLLLRMRAPSLVAGQSSAAHTMRPPETAGRLLLLLLLLLLAYALLSRFARPEGLAGDSARNVRGRKAGSPDSSQRAAASSPGGGSHGFMTSSEGRADAPSARRRPCCCCQALAGDGLKETGRAASKFSPSNSGQYSNRLVVAHKHTDTQTSSLWRPS